MANSYAGISWEELLGRENEEMNLNFLGCARDDKEKAGPAEGEVKANTHLATHRLTEMGEFKLYEQVTTKPKLRLIFRNK